MGGLCGLWRYCTCAVESQSVRLACRRLRKVPYPVTGLPAGRYIRACSSCFQLFTTLATHTQSHNSCILSAIMSTSPFIFVPVTTTTTTYTQTFIIPITPVIPVATTYMVQAVPSPPRRLKVFSPPSPQLCVQMLLPEACVAVLVL
jgi:hypothetical protein